MTSSETREARKARKAEEKRIRQQKSAARPTRKEEGHQVLHAKALLIYGEEETDLKPCVHTDAEGKLTVCPWIGKITRGKHSKLLMAPCNKLTSFRKVLAGKDAHLRCGQARYDVHDFLAESPEAPPPPDS